MKGQSGVRLWYLSISVIFIGLISPFINSVLTDVLPNYDPLIRLIISIGVPLFFLIYIYKIIGG